MSTRISKYIFFGVILFVVIGLIFTSVSGKNQDKVLLQDFSLYGEANKLLSDGRQDDAIKILTSLQNKYPDMYKLSYNLGLAYSTQKEFGKAVHQYQRALGLRPALLQDMKFTFKMGESLYFIKEYELAQKFLMMPTNPEDENNKNLLLKEIDGKLQGGVGQ